MSPRNFKLNLTSNSGGDVKIVKVNDGRTTENRPWHNISWRKNAGELKIEKIEMLIE